ncbi:MAG: ATP-dependent helicase Lhr and Lhr-like protein helicase [archaeon GW2011_AR10]|nr:MAG: ATP-dependent helicase Lhr and Lhr-like protein helicase [archaeon GW2011_AR10]
MAITFQKEKYSDAEIFRALNPLLSQWFKEKFRAFTEPQRYAILNIHHRENTLISAETGTGKTLAAFSAIISELLNLSQGNQLEEKVYCLYISPLRALNNDIHRNLMVPLGEIEEILKKEKKNQTGVRVAVRTGDTTTSERAKMLRKPPHILITTPESAAILINSPKFRENMRGIKWCIVDEIHALAENKRGVHLSLTLERMQRLSPEMCRVGLSATIAPLEEEAAFLAGMKNEKDTRDCKIVDVSFLKKMDLKVISPLPSFIDITQQQIHDSLYSQLDKLIQDHKTSLIFTNTRSATERVVHHLKEKFPERYSEVSIGAHHSSLSREHRLRIENKLKNGELKVVVSSTSLELGIDIGFIDLVVLLGSPKSVARAIQRMGRSGHQLHEKVKGRIIVLDRDDLVECSVLLKSAMEKKIDRILIPKNCIDVLAQHIYGIAIEEPIQIDELFRLVRKSYCFSKLSRLDFNETIDYLAGKYTSLEIRHVYGKIWLDEETGMVGKRGKMARIIYMTNIGTIPDEARITVKIGEQKIGTIDEGFLVRLKKGDVFVLGGQSYEFKFSRGMTAQVTAAYKRPPTVPSWFSEMLPLSFDLAAEIGRFRKLMEEKFKAGRSRKEILEFINSYLYVEKNAAEAIFEYFHEQFLYSETPHLNKLLIEQFHDEDGKNNLVFHSLFGRRTNDALSVAYAYAISKLMHKDVELSMNDNGFMISSYSKMPLDVALKAVKSSELYLLLERAIDKTEVLQRKFRHCAARSLMILRSYKGKTKTAGRQQMSARLLISAVKRISNDFPILKEARREVLEDSMDIQHAIEVVKAVEEGKIIVKKIQTDFPSPFAANIALQGRMDLMRVEERLEFLKRVHAKIEERIKEKATA